MAGIMPAWRRRRLAPFPSSLRPLAVSLCSVAIFVSHFIAMKPHRCGVGDSPATRGAVFGSWLVVRGWWKSTNYQRPTANRFLVDVQRTHRLPEGDAAHRFREQLGDAELADAAAGLRRVGERDGVG